MEPGLGQEHGDGHSEGARSCDEVEEAEAAEEEHARACGALDVETSQTCHEAVEHLMALGPDCMYVDCTFGAGGHSRAILERLSPAGRLLALAGAGSAAEAARSLAVEDGRLEAQRRPFTDISTATQDQVAGVLIDLGVSSLPLSDSSDGSGMATPDAPLDLRVDSQSGSPASEWLRSISAEELGWVIDSYGGLHDPWLSQRLAAAILRRQQDVGQLTSARELSDLLDALLPEMSDEHPGVDGAQVLLALRVFVNREVEELEAALAAAFERLAPHGRCVLLTYRRWELDALRRFLRANEEPSAAVRGMLPADQLARLYPLVNTSLAYAARRVVVPCRPSQQNVPAGQPRRSWMVHVLEKVPRDTQQAPSRPLASDDRQPVDATAPERPSLQGPPTLGPVCRARAPGVVAIGGSVAEAEMEELSSLIAKRKGELAAQGLGVRQQRRDPQVAEWSARLSALHRGDPGREERQQQRCRARPHVPVLLAEAVDGLVAPGPDRLYVDCTFGRGGHSSQILSRLSSSGRLKAFDVDPSAVIAGQALSEQDGRFEIIHRPFGDLAQALREPVAGVLLDLGVSSPQLDDVRRGFSLKSKKDGPLDLRMNPQAGKPASEWLQHVSVPELASAIETVGYRLDPPLPERIAEAILHRQREHGPYTSTLQLARVLQDLEAEFQDEHPNLHLAQIVFGSIRVILNHEMEQLEQVLEGAFELLEPYGRLAVITFTQWELAAVRRFLRRHDAPGERFASAVGTAQLAESWPAIAAGQAHAMQRVGRPQRPSPEELQQNPRARSSTLHVLEKVPMSDELRSLGRHAETSEAHEPAFSALPRLREPPRLIGPSAVAAPATSVG